MRQAKASARKTSPRRIREDLVMQAALEAYGQVRREGRLADLALEFTLRHKRNLYSQERRAVAERVYALLRRQRTVDEVLSRIDPGWNAVPSTRQDYVRLQVARLLLGETLSEIRDTGGLEPGDVTRLERFPNGLQALSQLPAPERFPIVASLPDFLAHKLWAQYGAEAEPLAEALNQRGPLTVRVNAHKTTREELVERLQKEEVSAHPTELSPLGVILDTRLNAFSLPSFKDGWFEIQDEGSQLLGLLVDAPPTKVLDACAGAGGKTLQLSAQMKNRGELIAMDIDGRRLEELKRRARRAGAHNIRIHPLPKDDPASVLAPFVEKMDRVLVDAPCTGSGAFRRNPDARYRLTEADLAMHVERQKALLDRFAPLVKVKGRLVYGTCSVLREENEDVVEAFLAKHPEFTLRPVAEKLGEALSAHVSSNGFLKTLPHRHSTDGFFGALFERTR